MENASKALLIAGGVLIAIMVFSSFIMMYNRISSLEQEQIEELETQQLAAFNAEFEAFDKKIMYGVDVITLLNKVAENNKKYLGDESYQIKVNIFDKNGNRLSINSGNDLVVEEKEKYIYKCTEMKYNDLGRVCEINILENN